MILLSFLVVKDRDTMAFYRQGFTEYRLPHPSPTPALQNLQSRVQKGKVKNYSDNALQGS